ncbi:unnamed protein product [Chrysodeixis includens]|uniref:Uncharacterized protein n=1 Tax=Chrysodeixis includens TaxID=689277 RepID=A0A9P0FYC8_CHRIL|nr:unnamed protein product [Chrysodeixis includens]
MGERHKIDPRAYTDYLQSVVKLDALEKMTQDLDRELADSQRIMMEIKNMYSSVSTAPMNMPVVPAAPAPNNALRHEDISKILEAGEPKLLMPDMASAVWAENSMDVDIDDVIATMKTYAEDLKKSLTLPEPVPKPKEMENLDLNQYAQSLDQLNKRLANIKLNKKDDLNNRSIELEGKLSQLCEDVNMFTKLVQAKTALSESNKNWVETQHDSIAMQYDNIINKLLSGINEVTYLLQNKN